MSQRGKRQASRIDDGPVATKRRKGRSVAVAEEEEATLEGWTPRSHSDLKMSTIYNRSATEAPAELFRKDLISAMKLPDSEPLSTDEYWVINDQWKQEWEKGVQVPVNPDSLPGPSVTVISQSTRSQHEIFKLPKNKYIRITQDDNFKPEEHHLSLIPSKAEKVCSYDLDNVDFAWLKIINGERAAMGLHLIREEQLERIVEELELRSWDKVQTIVKSEEGLGIEFDENVICDVCRSPDSEEGNEMVFCDSCNICVHQACYGITAIPAGQWLCRTCALGQRPDCVLCPNRGGAMKCTRSGQKWAHVSCALWIPEVSIGCVEKMEPITKISSIPQSRWALICVLCRERVGACIQCSVKSCKVAYHVTCAFKHGLEMRAIIEDENADDGVKLRSYCEKHSVNPKKDRCGGSTSEDEEGKRKKRKDMTSEEKNQARAAKLQEIEGEFEKHVSPGDVSKHHEVDIDGVTAIYNYWVLKRRAGNNKPLILNRPDDVDFLSRQQEQADAEKLKKFVQLRQDLERVRNLCYMVSRREKLSRTLFRMREQTFHKQIAVLSEPSFNLSPAEIVAIKESNHGPSIYDRIYSHVGAPDLSTDFETVLARIAGISPGDKGKPNKNGMRNKTENPYKRTYINGGLERRRSLYASMSSGSDTDIKRPPLVLDTSSTEGSKITSTKGKKRSKRRSDISRPTVDTSTEDESKPWSSPRSKVASSRSEGLIQMERELGEKTGSDDSDDLITFSSQSKKDSRSVGNIYSDTDSDSSCKDGHSESSHPLRTKAAMKEFTGSNQKKQKKSQTKSSRTSRADRESQPDSSLEDDYYKDKENVNVSKKKKRDSSSDLIVPQRQAAKKASESIRQGKTKGDFVLVEQDTAKTMTTVDDNKMKSKSHRAKGKDVVKDKNVQREDKSKTPSSNDIYEFDKDLCGDGQDIIAYVPQRQAARKATENIKSGLNKPVPDNDTDQNRAKPNELKPKKEVEVVKVKKEFETDKNKKVIKSPEPLKTRKTSKSSVSSSSSSTTSSSSSGSSSSSTSSSSESAEEEDDAKKTIPKLPLDKKSLFDPIPSKEETKYKPLEKKTEPKKKFEIASFLDKGKHSVNSSSTSSSSDSEDSIKTPTKKNEIITKQKPVALETQKDDSSLKVGMATKKLRKTPEKKLKTSDGRPELEFQQPPTERKESSRTQEPARTEEKIRRKSQSDRSGSGSSEIKSSSNSNKVVPPKDIGDRNKSKSSVEDRNKSQTSNRDRIKSQPFSSDRAKSEVTARENDKSKDESQFKKEISGRKRKQDDSEKQSPAHKSRKPSPRPAEHALIEEKAKQHSPTPSKKIDKKVESPSKKIDASESSVSTLEREIAERKAGRDQLGKSNSKKSLERLFEKRDKLVRENERKEQNALLKSSAPVLKSPEKLSFDSPKRMSRDLSKEKEIIIKDENKNDKINDQPWSSFNNTISNTLEPIHIPTKIEFPEKPVLNRRSLFSPEPDNVENIKIIDKNDEDSNYNSAPPILIKEDVHDSLPVLSPTPAQPDILFKHDSIPHLEKESVHVPSEINIIDPEKSEPKKVSSRTSSLSASNQHRSIFSPPPPKDSAAAEFFDFENDMLTVDDAFSISRDSDERAQPLSFTLNATDFIFKIGNSKEDNARETLNLVEKLRLGIGYVKKTQTDGEGENTDNNLEDQESIENKIEEDVKLEPPAIPTSIQITEETMSLLEPNLHEEIKPSELDLEEATKNLDPEATINLIKPIMDEAARRLGAGDPHLLPSVVDEKQEIPSYDSTDHYQYPTYSIPMEVAKVPGREKLDRSNSAQADERWVPPSVHSYEPGQSPYRNKWADSELMPSRHSSSSSASSTSSSSQREEIEPQKHEDLSPGLSNPPLIPEILPFQGLQPPLPYNPSCALANTQPYHFVEAASFQVPFMQAPPCPQLSYPATGSAMFPPNFSTSYSGQHTLVNKHPEETLHMPPPPCSAAFTASSHNMAITAAMVAPPPMTDPPPLTPLPFPAPDTLTSLPSLPPEQAITPESLPPPTPETFNHQPPASVSSEEPPTPKPVGKKSPQKPTRTSARCIAQQTKSPAKSPGKSPRQLDARGRGKDKRGRPSGKGINQRGRGRGRGRGRNQAFHNDNTITSKLIGTVYDFDVDEDEEGGDSLENLRAMRERRKSSDLHDKKSDASYITKESPLSNKLTSPLHHKSRGSYLNETKVIVSPDLNQSKDTLSEPARPVDVFEPLLPGPVDMRTYSSCNTSSSAYQNHLLESFSTVPPPEPPTKVFFEELEEEIETLQSTTVTKFEVSSVPKVTNDELPQVSYEDSRNQLKFKIKGPFLDANYAASSQTRPSAPNTSQSEGSVAPPSVTNSGTSNLRRMRKKELLRQYWTQDMNMDEAATTGPPAVPTQDPLVNRTVITIPKAVASMTTIPTREDYKAVVDANMEKKRKKEKTVPSHEQEEIPERRKSVSSSHDIDVPQQPQKRKGRAPRTGTTPKLKIKIGGNGNNEMSVSTCTEERKNLRVRPPKKRLTNVPKPTVEELKRESMKYRKMVMAGFDEEEEEVIEARSRKRKKKSFDDPPSVVRVINAEAAPKLIIRFGKRPEEEVNSLPPSPPPQSVESEPLTQQIGKCEERTSDDNPAVKKVRTSKITPIKLKLSRCEEGYVMKVPVCDSVGQTGSELSTEVRETPPALSLSKDCEVR